MPTSKRPYHFGDLRGALLAEGESLLTEVGPAEISLREIARRIGVSHNAPYRHFATKEALLAAIAAAGFDTLAARLEKPASDPEAFGRAYVEFALERPAVFRLMFSGLLDRSAHPDLELAADRSLRSAQHFVRGTYGTDEGAMMAAWAFVHGVAMLLLDGQVPAALRGGRSNVELASAILGAMANTLPSPPARTKPGSRTARR
jgi:AcrR family transcriptional regulator